jgi:serine phosphatase RsbU (regulator of sigma subunit)
MPDDPAPDHPAALPPRRMTVPLPAILAETMAWTAAAWENSPAAVSVMHGPNHLLIWQNAASLALFGRLPLGLPVAQAIPGTTLLDLQILDAVLATGEPVTRERHAIGLRDPSGRDVFARCVASPYGPPGRPPEGVVLSAIDLSGEARAELAANRSRLVAEATHVIAGARDPLSALQALTDVLVPQLADVAAVYVLPGVRDAAALATRPGRPDAVSVSPELAHLGPPPAQTRPRGTPAPFQEMMAAGHAVVVPFEGHDPAVVAADPAAREWMLAARARNVAAVPLSVAGTLMGALVLISAGDRQPYSEPILPFLTDLAARAGLAIAQLRQQLQQAETARKLQQALLPVTPPALPGLQVAARYLAGSADVEVGGDWWDVVPLGDSRVAVSVGDACGRGVDAAILMGQARVAARIATLAGLAPAQVLALVDRHVATAVAEAGREGTVSAQFATALQAVLDLGAGQVRIANAGHLPVLVHAPGSDCRVVAIPPGPPLGLGLNGYQESVLDLPPGGSLLMFTDGLVEDRTHDLDVGLASLASELAQHVHHDAGTCLDKILAGLRRGVAPFVASDDVAVLLVRRLADPHLPG